MHYVFDNNGKKYLIKKIDKFFQHLVEFHTDNGRANNSIHEENGYYFTVTSELFKRVEEFVLNFKR